MPAKTRAPAAEPAGAPPAQTRKAPAKKAAAAPQLTFATPDAAEPADVLAPRMVDGQEVVSDEPERSPLSGVWGKFIPIVGRRVLTLKDGSTVFGCADCPETGTRGDIMKHRVEKHGAAKSGARTPARKAPGPDLSWLGITIGDVIDLAQHLGSFEVELDRIRDERDAERSGRLAAEKELNQIKRALAKVGFVVKVDEETE